MKFHPFSEIFPLLEGPDFDALVADLSAHGLREKIWLYEGKVLDGRNRFLACQKAKVKPLTRKYTGKDADALAFVWSANMQRRHLKEGQRAMAASKYREILSANLHSGDVAEAAAEATNVSRRSVFHADKVREKGSKALQKAVESGELAVSKAAAVVQMPKPQQLAAAKEKPAKVEPQLPPEAAEGWEPEIDEGEKIAAIEKELADAVDKVMSADDKLAAAHTELKRQAAEIAVLKLGRDGFMNGKSVMTRLLKAEQRKTEKLTKELEKALAQNESLRERVAIMEAA